MKELHILNNGDSLYDIRTHINENFETVKDSKNIIYTASTTNIVADNVQGAIDSIGNKINGYAKFTVNDGNYTNNVEDLLTYSANTLSFKVGNAYPNLIATKGDGTTFTRYEIPSQDLSSYTDGNYIVYCNEQQTEILNSALYEQQTEPVSPNENDIWRNTNTDAAYKFEGGSTWTIFDKVPVGTVTKSGNTITNVNTYPYNRTALATTTQAGILRVATQTDELNYNCNDAAITPENLHRIENFRLANTEYNVNDTVGCPYHHNLQLTCTQAGTTSSESLDTHNISSGDTITDGSVIWTVGSIEIDSSNFVHKTGNETINGTKTFTETIVGNISGNAENDGEGNNIVKTYARKDEIGGGSGVSIGTMFSAMCTNTYIPDGALPLDGTEYSKEQFSDFYDNYLVGQTTTAFNSDIFTRVGTPNISDDGIMHVTTDLTNDSDYAYISSSLLPNLSEADTWSIILPAVKVTDLTNAPNGRAECYFCNGNGLHSYIDLYRYYVLGASDYTDGNPFSAQVVIGSSLTNDIYLRIDESTTSQLSNILQPGMFIKSKVEFTGTGYNLYVDNNEQWVLCASSKSTDKIYNIGDYIVGRQKSNTTEKGNYYLDLKTLFITVNGQEVLKGVTETSTTSSKLLTCSYTQYNSDISTYGQCSKFGVSEPQFVGWITAEQSYNIHVNESLTLTDYMEKVPYNGIKISADAYNLPTSSSWSITTPKQKLVLTDNVEHNCALFLLKATDNSDLSVNAGYDTEISMYYNTQYNRMTCRIYTGFNTYNETVFGNIVVDTNKYYTYRIEYTGSNYNFYRTEEGSTNEELIGTIKVSDGLYITTKPYLYIDSVGIWDENAYSIQNFETLRFSSSLYGVSPSLEEFKFRVPTIKDGSSVTQAQSDSELGKMYSQSCTAGTGVNSDTVRMRYFVQVADGQINQSQMDWSNWATSLSGKLNADIQSNITEEGKAYIKSLVGSDFPLTDGNYTTVHITSSYQTFTVPFDCWAVFSMVITTSNITVSTLKNIPSISLLWSIGARNMAFPCNAHIIQETNDGGYKITLITCMFANKGDRLAASYENMPSDFTIQECSVQCSKTQRAGAV